MEEDRFAVDELAGHELPDGTVIARNRRTGAQMPLPGEVFNAVSHCDSFRTMEGHIADLAGPAARGREGEIRQILQSVIDAGLTLSAAAIGARLEQRQETEMAARPVAAIITRERPEALSRLLSSILEHCRLEEVQRLVIVDDSRDEAALAANREAISKAREKLEARGLPSLLHFGPQEGAALTQAIKERLPGHIAGIEFLLGREDRGRKVTTGIVRNFAQLLSVGSPLLVFDDDVLCSVLQPPERRSGVEFSARQRGSRFFASDDEWRSHQEEGKQCPIQLHMQALGAELGGCLRRLDQERPGPSAFEFATPGFARRLQANAPILITQCGCYGDPGSGGNEWTALLPAEERAELAALVDNPETAPQVRNCWLGRSRPVFEPRANMSQVVGIDNRGYLPPYFPLFRGQDQTFGAMTEFLNPSSLAVDLPFALPHLPIPRRSWRDLHAGFSLPFSLTHFLNDFVTGEISNCGALDTRHRNEWLAMMFQDLAVSPRSRIIEISAGHWTQKRIDWLTRLSNALDTSTGTPPPLGPYLVAVMRQLRASGIADFRATEIKGPPENLSGDEVLEFWRKAWQGFADGLRAWPHIREVARETLEL